jgi:protein-S-isoprenylcysteine O-methyltransferase Ste14
MPTTIDGQPGLPALQALLVDLGLLTLFAVQHSGMARPGFKKLWTRIVPPAAERSTYVLLSSLCLFAICWRWQTLPGVLWRLEGAAAALAWAGFALGWLVVLASTFMVSHAELFGLSQAVQAYRGHTPPPPQFRERWLYRVMSAARLVFALVTTAYILVALQLEERDLRRAFGAQYDAYRARVPMLLPRPARRAQQLTN